MIAFLRWLIGIPETDRTRSGIPRVESQEPQEPSAPAQPLGQVVDDGPLIKLHYVPKMGKKPRTRRK